MTGAEIWDDAILAATLFTIDPGGLGGVAVRAQAGPVRDAFLGLLPGRRRLPHTVADDALLGGLDLAATLDAGRPIRTQGLLAEAKGGILVAAMAERMPAGLAGRLGAAMEAEASIGIVALDEGAADDERASPALLDRLAFHLDLSNLGYREAPMTPLDARHIAQAGQALLTITASDDIVESLCAATLALGIASPRAGLLAFRAARAAAALACHAEVTPEDAAVAARLVLAPRATILPPGENTPSQEQAATSPPGQDKRNQVPPAEAHQPDEQADQATPDKLVDTSEIVLAAARAAIPAGLLARLHVRDFRGVARSSGSEGARHKGLRGRPVGVRAGLPAPGLRLNLIETLRAAAPWQFLRAQTAPIRGRRLHLRREDLRITRSEARARSTTVFLVDASGSAALNRLAEAKGAVELLLADCYRRRDEVAVLAFRGRTAQLLLPPTRSLVRAKRSLAGLPGGGGTPLAAGLDAVLLLAEAVRRAGCTPTVVLLTDGRANVTRAGTGGRAEAQRDATDSARRLRAAGIASLVLDTAPRPGPEAAQLAAAMGARYVALPYANAAGVSDVVRATLAGPIAGRA